MVKEANYIKTTRGNVTWEEDYLTRTIKVSSVDGSWNSYTIDMKAINSVA